MTVVDAILEAGGIIDDVLHCKVEISRLNPESVSQNKYAEIFYLNLKNDSTIFNYDNHIYNRSNLHNSTQQNNILLEPFDVITVREDPYFKDPKVLLFLVKYFILENI